MLLYAGLLLYGAGAGIVREDNERKVRETEVISAGGGGWWWQEKTASLGSSKEDEPKLILCECGQGSAAVVRGHKHRQRR